MKIRLFAFDLDGTLVDRAGNISAENLRAVDQARASGAEVMIVTGRSWRSTLPYYRELGMTGPAICYLGALVVADGTGRVIDHLPLAPEAWHLLRRLALAERLAVTAAIAVPGDPAGQQAPLASDAVWATGQEPGLAADPARTVDDAPDSAADVASAAERGHDPAVDVTFATRRLPDPYADAAPAVKRAPGVAADVAYATGPADDFRGWEDWNPYTEIDPALDRCVAPPTMAAVYGDRSVRRVLEAFPHGLPRAQLDLSDHIEGETVLHVWHEAVDKGRALARYCRERNIPPEAVMALGDAPVDVTMLRFAGIGVAVPGSHPAALAAADWVASPAEAVARALSSRR